MNYRNLISLRIQYLIVLGVMLERHYHNRQLNFPELWWALGVWCVIGLFTDVYNWGKNSE